MVSEIKKIDQTVRFSIIVPVLNAADTLTECLDSALNQTYPNIEIICVYDESTDDSLRILHRYEMTDSRIQVIQGNGTNLSGARNVGMTSAKGEYLLFLDADDSFTPDTCSVLDAEIRESACDIIVFSYHIFPHVPISPAKYVYQQAVWNVNYPTYSPKALFHELGAKPYVWRNCYRKEMIEHNHLSFDEDMVVGEDLVFQAEVFPFAKNGIRFLNKQLYNYRWFRPGSLQNTYDKAPRVKLLGHIRMVEAIFRFWEDRKIPDKHELNQWAIDFLAEEIPDLPETLREPLLQESIAVLDTYIPEANRLAMPHVYRRKYNELKYGRIPRSFLVKRIREFFRFWKIYGFSRTTWLVILRLRHGGRKLAIRLQKNRRILR